MRRARRWTREEDAVILRLHADGVGDIRIGRMLDRSPGSVSGRRARLAASGMSLHDYADAQPRITHDEIGVRVARLCDRYGWRGLELLP